MKITDIIYKNIQKRKSKIALCFDNNEFSWEELSEEINIASESLEKYSINNKVVAIYQEKPLLQLIYFFAVSKCGAIPLLVHEYLKPKDVEKLLQREKIPFIWSNRNVGNISLDKKGIGKTKVNSKKFIGDFAVLTSGTTSLPKCYYRYLESWSDFFKTQEKIFHYNENSSLYIQGSFAFTGNLNMLLAFWNIGAKVVGTSAVAPKTWSSDLKTKNITHLYFIPTKLSLLARVFSRNETLKYILTGSQMMTETLWKELKKSFTKAEFILYYGSSEASYIAYIDGKNMNFKKPSVGKAVKNVKVSVKNGELHITTPYGIIGLPKMYASHDLGEINENGEIILYGRNDEVYTIHGNHVYGQYVEQTLKSISFIEDAVVTYKKSERKLIGIIATEKNFEKKEILSELRKKLAPWEIPEKFIKVKKIPYTSTGKHDRKEIEKMLKNI